MDDKKKKRKAVNTKSITDLRDDIMDFEELHSAAGAIGSEKTENNDHSISEKNKGQITEKHNSKEIELVEVEKTKLTEMAEESREKAEKKENSDLAEGKTGVRENQSESGNKGAKKKKKNRKTSGQQQRESLESRSTAQGMPEDGKQTEEKKSAVRKEEVKRTEAEKTACGVEPQSVEDTKKQSAKAENERTAELKDGESGKIKGKDTVKVKETNKEENKKTVESEKPISGSEKDATTTKNSVDSIKNEKSAAGTEQKKKETDTKKVSDTKDQQVQKQEKDLEDDLMQEPLVTLEVTKPKGNLFSQYEAKGNRTLKIGLSVAAALLLIVYVSGFVYFSGHFYQNAQVNGIDVSGMDKDTAAGVVDQFYRNYILVLDTIDGDKVEISGKDISMQVALQEDVGSCLKQQKAYVWFVQMFGQHDFEIAADVQWDEYALSELFDSMNILEEKKMTAPQDAYVGIRDGELTIIKEVTGNTMLTGTFKKVVKQCLSEVQPELKLVENGCYELPKVYDTDETLQKELDAKMEYAQNEIKLQLDDLTLEPNMELYDEVLVPKGDGYQISKELVEQYVGDLAEQYNTVGTDRIFTTSFSDQKVEVNGISFGYEMNQEETVNALYQALTSGKSTTVEVVFDKKGKTLQGENDIGSTYIEVNLSEQKVIAYQNGKKIAEGDCVSGNESAGHGTSIGLYEIQGKQSPSVLRGEKKPVTKTVTKKKKGKKVTETVTTYEYEYESPVTYWMPFNGGIGLHDAAGWRSAYGGSIYYYSGSHGCVNLPLDLAKTLYENFDIGTPVIVYFWDNANRK